MLFLENMDSYLGSESLTRLFSIRISVSESSSYTKKKKRPSTQSNPSDSATNTHSLGSVRPGNGPVHHPHDARLLASMRQHLAHSLTRRHAVCGGQLLLHGPLFGRTGQHWDG